MALIDELGMADRVLISSFNHTYLERAKTADPKIATAALVEKADPDPSGAAQAAERAGVQPAGRRDPAAEIGSAPGPGFRRLHLDGQRREDHARPDRSARASGIFTDFPQLLKPLVEGCK